MEPHRPWFVFLLSRLLDLLIPPRANDRIVRDMSDESLTRLVHPTERGGVFFLLPYKNKSVTALVWELKFRRNEKALRLAAHVLAEEIVGIASEELSPPLLLPVPMSDERRHVRGYNQTEDVCASVARILGHSVVYRPGILVRIKNSPSQQSLSRKERLLAMQNTMGVQGSAVRGRTCIVLDDVTTTGATLKEARRALKEAGARKSILLALAG